MSTPARRVPRSSPSAAVVPLCGRFGDDRALAVALQSGRPGAPAALVERYGAYVQGLLYRVVGIDRDIPDLAQEVFLRALQGVSSLKEPDALRGWLGSITVFTVRAYLRQRRFRRRWLRFVAPEELPEIAAPGLGIEAAKTLRRAYEILEDVPPRLRIPFTLRRIEGLPLTEIAALCGISLATAKRRIAGAERWFLERARQDPLLNERLEAGGRWRDR